MEKLQKKIVTYMASMNFASFYIQSYRDADDMLIIKCLRRDMMTHECNECINECVNDEFRLKTFCPSRI